MIKGPKAFVIVRLTWWIWWHLLAAQIILLYFYFFFGSQLYFKMINLSNRWSQDKWIYYTSVKCIFTTTFLCSIFNYSAHKFCYYFQHVRKHFLNALDHAKYTSVYSSWNMLRHDIFQTKSNLWRLGLFL